VLPGLLACVVVAAVARLVGTSFQLGLEPALVASPVAGAGYHAG
jgi:hypothetical protein